MKWDREVWKGREEKRKGSKGRKGGEGKAEWGRQREIKKKREGRGKQKIALYCNYASYARILNMSTQKQRIFTWGTYLNTMASFLSISQTKCVFTNFSTSLKCQCFYPASHFLLLLFRTVISLGLLNICCCAWLDPISKLCKHLSLANPCISERKAWDLTSEKHVSLKWGAFVVLCVHAWCYPFVLLEQLSVWQRIFPISMNTWYKQITWTIFKHLQDCKFSCNFLFCKYKL